MSKINNNFLKLSALALAVGAASTANAIDFNLGPIEGRFDSQVSAGVSWGVSKPDSRLIDTNNGGTGASSTGDDGRLNFKRGETFSKIIKGVHDLELKYEDSGAFFRGKYWYDFELEDESRRFKQVSNQGGKNRAKTSGVDLLDAFVFRNYDLLGKSGHVRLGQQVVSWGESTFIGGGINAINPWDVSALRRPGAELKEGLLPVPMVFVSQRLTDDLNIEGFYQLKWEPYVLDNCGTFFATDVAAPGCNDNFTVLDGGLSALSELGGFKATSEGVIIARERDRKAKNAGQWGVALRFQTDNTEYGFYVLNYHSRTPYLAYRAADASVYGNIENVMGSAINLGITDSEVLNGLAAATVLGSSTYLMDYPENLQLYGLSFATSLPTGTAWSGEISHHPNAPVGLNATDMTMGLLNPIEPGISNLEASSNGVLKGYKRKEITQIQSTFIHTFDQILGAEQLALVGEAVYIYTAGLENKSHIRYGRDTVFGDGSLSGYTTKDTFAYRVAASLEYSNVFSGVNLEPNLAWSHDVVGYGPNDGFIKHAKAISVGIDANYLSKYSASINYTNFFGGAYNTEVDRDFISLSTSINF